MEAFSFGSYYAGRSFIHRLDPRTKLLAGFGFLFIALASALAFRMPWRAFPRTTPCAPWRRSWCL